MKVQQTSRLVKSCIISLIACSILIGCNSENKTPPKEVIKIGYVDNFGQLKLPDEYMILKHLNQNLQLISKATVTISPDGKKMRSSKGSEPVGLIARDGILILPIEYQKIHLMTDSVLSVKKNSQYGLFDTTGQSIINIEYEQIEKFSETLVRVKQNNKWGIVDTQGKIVLPLQYDEIDILSDGLARVKQNNLYGFIDSNTKIAIPIQYLKAGRLSEDLISVVAKVEYTPQPQFIDKTGNVVLSLPYEYAGSFSDGLATVKKSNKWGVIDKTGKLIIPLNYESIQRFPNNLFFVKINNGNQLINIEGKNILPVEGNFASKNTDGFITLSNHKNKYGLMDTSGKIIVPMIYDSEPFIHHNMISVKKDKKVGFYDMTGKLIIPVKYDSSVSYFSSGTVRGVQLKLNGESFKFDTTGQRVE